MRYLIRINPFGIDSYYRTNFNPKFANYNHEASYFVLNIQEEYNSNSPELIFNPIGNHYFVTKNLKIQLEEKFLDISFEYIPTVYYNERLDNIVWYKVNFNEFSFTHFHIYNKELFVSQEALDFLKRHNIFKENFIGEAYGKTYNIYTNIFEFEGSNLAKFVGEKLPEIESNIAKVRQEIDMEYSRITKS